MTDLATWIGARRARFTGQTGTCSAGGPTNSALAREYLEAAVAADLDEPARAEARELAATYSELESADAHRALADELRLSRENPKAGTAEGYVAAYPDVVAQPVEHLQTTAIPPHGALHS